MKPALLFLALLLPGCVSLREARAIAKVNYKTGYMAGKETMMDRWTEMWECCERKERAK